MRVEEVTSQNICPTTNFSAQDSTFLSTISISLYIDSTSARKQGPPVRRPRVMTSLSHTAKLRTVLESSGVDVVLPLQEFKYNLLG